MTLFSRISLFALVLSYKAFANPLQQAEPSQQISDDIGVDAFPNTDTLRELAVSPDDATANPGSLYAATGDSLDRPGSTTVTSWQLALADSNGSPAVAKSNEIWQQQAVETPQHPHQRSITAEITYQYKNEPTGDSPSGSVCKANTAARLFRKGLPWTFQPCCFPIEIGLVLVERHAFCCEGGHVDIAPIRQNCILCISTLSSPYSPQKKKFIVFPFPLGECSYILTSWERLEGYCDAKEKELS